MDVETLSNHICNLGRNYFDKACTIVLNEVFEFTAINVDGKSDGGTDFTTFKLGEREKVAYQITTQKTDIKNKAYKDAQKAIDKLGIQKFYFLTTYNLSEIEQRLIESDISKDLKISATCLSPKIIAGLIINSGKLNKLLESIDYPLPRQHGNIVDIKEKALHSYSIFSEDTSKLKFSVYEDTILFALFEKELTEDKLIASVISFLNLDEDKYEFIKKRIGGLFGKALIKKDANDLISLTEHSKQDLKNRQSVYEIELNNLSSAQTDLLTDKYNIPWTSDDSKKISLWIANSYISNQLENLHQINASIVNNNFYNISDNGTNKLRQFLLKDKKISNESVDEIVTELLDMAATHPLINKITRASVYVALDGNNPIASAKALGVSRWSDVNIIVEPSIGIPYLCSLLYSGNTNRFFKNSVKSINQAKSLDSQLFIPYYYINECAGHLLSARKYIGFESQEKELEFSRNAFISNYFNLKNKGIKVPSTISQYLETFSSAIKFERDDTKAWVRSIMTDIQSLFTANGIEFIDVPHYSEEEIRDTELFFKETLDELNIAKKFNLFRNDIYTLKSTNDRIVKDGEVWVILTNDRSLISFSKTDYFKGWITNPIKFLEITELSKPMSESKLVSLVHSVATFSEKTLSLGARIMDKIISLSSKDIQNWELKAEIDKFKNETIESINIDDPDSLNIIDIKTDEFINKHGLNVKDEMDELPNDDIIIA